MNDRQLPKTRIGRNRALPVIASIMLSMTAMGADDSAKPESARALVSTMGLDRSALLGVRLAVEDGVKQGTADPALMECANKLEPASFVELFAAEIQSALTASEIESAQSFYASPLGQKSVEAGLQQTYRSVGRTPPGPALTFTPAEAKESETFSKTPAGDKLIVKQILGAPRVASAVQSHIGNLLSICMHAKLKR
jgi:hypothetical protein